MKKINLGLLVLLFLFGIQTIEAKSTPWDNGKLRVSDNNRYLQHENGEPFFWLGETAWLLPSRSDRNEVDYFMGTTKKNGYNVVQISPLHTIPSVNHYGKWALPDGFDFSKIDKYGDYGYWDHVDYIVKSAARNNIYIALVCVWGGPVDAGQMSVDDARKYGTFLGNRYKNDPNIIWLIGGDIRGDHKPEVWKEMAKAIKKVDKNHLMTFHPRGRTSSTTWFNDEDWLDFNMFQSGHRRYNQRYGDGDYPIEENTEEDNWRFVESSLATKPLKPVIDGEPSYEDIPHGLHDASERYWQAEDVRRYAYWSVFAGSFGHTYGHNSTMQMIRPGYGASFAATQPWWEAIHDEGCQQMKFLKKLMLAFPFFERVPDQSVIQNENTDNMQYYRIIATRGDDYILVYNYVNRAMEIDLSKISGAKKKAWWYDPTDGKLEYIGEFNNGIHRFLNDSYYGSGNDFVLIITDASVNYVQDKLEKNE